MCCIFYQYLPMAGDPMILKKLLMLMTWMDTFKIVLQRAGIVLLATFERFSNTANQLCSRDRKSVRVNGPALSWKIITPCMSYTDHWWWVYQMWVYKCSLIKESDISGILVSSGRSINVPSHIAMDRPYSPHVLGKVHQTVLPPWWLYWSAIFSFYYQWWWDDQMYTAASMDLHRKV